VFHCWGESRRSSRAGESSPCSTSRDQPRLSCGSAQSQIHSRTFSNHQISSTVGICSLRRRSLLQRHCLARYTPATKSTVDKTATYRRQSRLSTLSPICCRYFRLCRWYFRFVADLSPVCRKSTVAGSFDFVDRHCRQSWTCSTRSTSRLCRKWVIFVSQMSSRTSFRLCRQCVPGFTAQRWFLIKHANV